MNQQPDEVLRKWRESAYYWKKHRQTIRSMFAPLTEAMMEISGIAEGRRVLDVGGGTGEPSLAIAAKFDSVHVVCTDPVGEMVRAAREEAFHRGLSRLQFCCCSGQQLPFHSNTFDAVVSRLSSMFFPDPAAALREILRVVRPGSRITFVVWHHRESNPLFHAVTDVLDRYIESPPEDPDAPGAFRFAPPEKLAALLTATGAVEVQEQLLKFLVEAPLSLDDFWTVRSEMSDTMRDRLALLSAEQQASVAEEVKETVRGYFDSGHMRIPAEAIVVGGSKP